MKNLVFIVAYNHQSKIESVLARIPASFTADRDNEVLVIDDGSLDDTFSRGTHFKNGAEWHARLTILKNPVNQGYGGNQKLGYRYAIDNGFERVFLIHGDGQYAPELLPNFIAEYENSSADAVFGTRIHPSQNARKGGMPLYKYLGNQILTRLQNYLLGTKLWEFHSGYRSYSTRLLKTIPFERNSNMFHFDTEIIIQCHAAGAKLVEIPIPTHYGDEVCHVPGLSYAREVIVSCLHFRLHRAGFLYDRKFDLGDSPYVFKPSIYSSHTLVTSRVAQFSRVLDVGCGQGNIARLLIARGCEVDGVDIIPQSETVATFREYRRMDLQNDMADLATLVGEREYDYIVLADIIEHLLEPEELLVTIRNALTSPRAHPTIVISTPNVAFIIVRAMLALGRFNYGRRGILDRTHRRLFTASSLTKTVEQCGYQVDERRGTGLPFSLIFSGGLGEWLDRISSFFARIMPGLFAYQFVYVIRPLPTTKQLLTLCREYSSALTRKLTENAVEMPLGRTGSDGDR